MDHPAIHFSTVLAAFFAIMAILRLARFNLETDNDAASHQEFKGLPSPAAAGTVASTVWLYLILKRPDLEKYAEQVGLNMAKFKADLDQGTYKAHVAADQALANKVGARGTPTFFINGRKLVGAQPLSGFTALIDEVMKKK